MELLTNIMETIKTYDGTDAYRKDCRYIKGIYYKKNVQCFNIDGTWYRINSNKIVFDHEVKKWVLRESYPNIIDGIVDIDDSTPIMGKFTPNITKNDYLYYNGSLYLTLNDSFLINNKYITEGLNGKYYFKNQAVPREFTTKVKPRRENFYSFAYNYGSDPLIPIFSENFDKGFKGMPLLSDAWKHLGKFTFGVEFETEAGAIPEKYLINNGLIACRDGSITGFEYTTIPLKGESGIQCIKTSGYLLDKYCVCSPNESLHIHIGGYPRTIKNIAALYRLGVLIEHQIYSMFPYYYINTSNFKRKGYCNPLYKLDANLNDAKSIFIGIYNYLSGGANTFSKFPTGTHPMDRSGQHKWEISPRYHWLNLIPLIWGNRGTVEFRCHIPTVRSQKVINWLFITVAILKYALKHTKELTSEILSKLPEITLKDILQEAYPDNISNILIDYIKQRKLHYGNRNDIVGEMEIISERTSKLDLFTLTEFV